MHIYVIAHEEYDGVVHVDAWGAHIAKTESAISRCRKHIFEIFSETANDRSLLDAATYGVLFMANKIGYMIWPYNASFRSHRIPLNQKK